MNIYKARPGSGLGNKKAQIYGKCIEQIEKKNGKIHPRDIVMEAQNNKSPLHEYFDWDNTSAAEKFRLHQARNLLGSIIIIVNVKGVDQNCSAFVNITVDDRGYMSTGRAINIKTYRDNIIKVALRDYVYWENKYNTLKELAEIFCVGNKVKRKYLK